MRLLLDTQAVLWFVGGEPHLSTIALNALESEEHDLTISIVSFWEISIKLNLRKLILKQPFDAFISRVTQHYGMVVLPVSTADTELIATLPRHHKDPFDRMIAGQALAGDFRLVSSDPIFDQYGVRRLW